MKNPVLNLLDEFTNTTANIGKYLKKQPIINKVAENVNSSINQTKTLSRVLGTRMDKMTPEEQELLKQNMGLMIGNIGGVKKSPINLEALAEQEGKFGKAVRTLNPYQGTLDKKGIFEIPVYNQKTREIVKKYKYNSLNDANNALKRLVVNEGEIAIGPNELMFNERGF